MARENDIEADFKQWEEETVSKTLSKFPERSEKFETISGVGVNRLYTPLDTRDIDYRESL